MFFNWNPDESGGSHKLLNKDVDATDCVYLRSEEVLVYLKRVTYNKTI